MRRISLKTTSDIMLISGALRPLQTISTNQYRKMNKHTPTTLSANPTPVPNLPSRTGNPSGSGRGNAPTRK